MLRNPSRKKYSRIYLKKTENILGERKILNTKISKRKRLVRYMASVDHQSCKFWKNTNNLDPEFK